MYRSTNGIGLLVVKDLAQIPAKQDGRGLVMQVDEGNVPLRLYYYDVLGRVELDPDVFDMRDLENLAQAKEVNLSPTNPSLIYLSPQEINSTLSVQADAIRDERQIVTEYLRRHPDQDKLSRKESGLENSYVRDGDNQAIALESKDECRVVWQDDSPSVNIFKNLPANTSAAYVVVQSEGTGEYDIYYIRNQENATPVFLKSLDDPQTFRDFYLNNAAASQKDLENINIDTRHRHKNQATNVLGAGTFGRVKKSRSMLDDSSRVTKAQVLPEKGKILNKLANRDARVRSVQQEARVSADVHGGSDKVSVTKRKAYMHMPQLGEPLSKVIPELDMAGKIDLTIKFLSAVAALHRGDTESRTRYAHRDIKPLNVLYNRKTGKVHLVDFGASTSNILNKSEMETGTLYYSALDQSVINQYIQGLGPVANVEQDVHSVESSDSEHEVAELESDFWNDSEQQDIENEPLGLDSEEDESVHDIDEDSGFNFVDTAADKQKPAGNEDRVAAGQNKGWQNKLQNKELCLTENYLEDDKVASLRTVSCNPTPVKPGTVPSIFTAEEFASFPEPIRAVFDSTTIAPLLTDERRGETLDFFAAVMISYKANPNLSDREYNDLISSLRRDPVLQVRLQDQYKHTNDPKEVSLDGNYSIDLEDSVRSDTSIGSPVSSAEDTDIEDNLDSPLTLGRKIKPITEDDLNKPAAGKYRVKSDDASNKGFFRGITNYFKKRKGTVSPTTTDELSSSDDETDDRSITPKN